MLTNGYTYNERLGVMWLWTTPGTTLVLRPVSDANLDLLLEEHIAVLEQRKE